MNKYYLALSMLFLSSCSVVMASRVDGIDFASLEQLCYRAQYQNVAMETLSTEYNDEGDLTETYKMQNERGSLMRAVLHTLLDIGSFCAWELIATPWESALDEEKFYSVQVTFDQNERVKKMIQF